VIRPQKNSLETILVVEDQPVVLDAVREILERAGFCVLATGSGAAAIEMESATRETIHMLLSDVMMPDMSGPDVAKALRKHRPDMRVMLMSGYPDGDMLFLNYGWHFIEKPFLPAKLVERVNDILHTPLRTQGDDHFDTRVKSKEDQDQWLEMK
jgi:two-component system cell cycle sensor histidine kinase/response regulator CckA